MTVTAHQIDRLDLDSTMTADFGPAVAAQM
jgi:hypothetical protein